MSFNSLEFLVFAAIVFGIYGFVFQHERARDIFLLLVSYVFYSAWYWEYSLLILASTVTDYFVGRALDRTERKSYRRALLALSLSFNIGVLAFFKYFNFFASAIASSSGLFGFELSSFRHELLLPIGISFYTFQTLSYTIDLYRRKIDPERSFLKFAVFVSFFPQLVAGPIVRASAFLPQLHNKTVISERIFRAGLFLVFFGLIKKIVIADSLAAMAVDAAFHDPAIFSSLDLLLALYAYAFQIYCDFSGYSDIAIGLALMLGFSLPKNFDRPYISKDPSEFWTRWHISLSSWLKDYLYIALGGNSGGKLRIARNVLITMLLGGLWHGAALNFVLWGAYHGVLLVIYRPFRPAIKNAGNISRKFLVFLNFHLVLFGWLLFRSSDVSGIMNYLEGLDAGTWFTTSFSPGFFLLLSFAFLWHFSPTTYTRKWVASRVTASPIALQALAYCTCLIVFLGLSVGAPQFIYFQF